ncbi:Uncharacterised protein [Bordetella ansorpii]|uniref:Uncharacterized protein n=1 Tax=Bordetella ansorpii TaxID=288768 RepID=A0A157RSA4_9BORD|nr:Uncharacterised protein [Bordetella ansorpii]
MARAAEADIEPEHAFEDLAVDGELMRQGGIRMHLVARGLVRGPPARAFVERAVELAQIIEQHLRGCAVAQGVALRSRTQLLQDAVAQATPRHGTQRLLDAADGLARLARGGQHHRIDAGEPANGARQVDVRIDVLAAVALQVDGHRRYPARRAQGAAQGGQQQIVDLAAIGRGCALEQGLGFFTRQRDAQAVAVALRGRAVRMGASQRRRSPLGPPVVDLRGVVRRMAHQGTCPVLVTAAARGQRRGFAGQGLLVGLRQILQQNAPRHAVDGQMVDHQQQARRPVGHRDGHRAQQRPGLHVQAALGLLADLGDRGRAGGLAPPDHAIGHLGLGLRRRIGLAPLAVFIPAVTQPQGIVMGQQGHDGAAHRREIQRLGAVQQHGLIPLLFGHVARQEVGLDGQQRHLALRHGARRRVAARGGFQRRAQRGQAGDGLRLEHLARRQRPAGAAQARHDLQAENGVATDLEEVVVPPHGGQTQHLDPCLGQQGFQGALRRFGGQRRLCRERRQRAPVDLAIGIARQARQHLNRGRHHVLRQALRHGLAQCVGLRRLRHLGVQADIGHQPVAARLALGQRHGLAHARLRQQGRLDLARFDAQAAHLDLEVGAAHIIELPILAPAHQVARAVHARAVRAVRIGHETFGTEAGARQIALRQSRAGQVELTGHAGRHRTQIGIEHARRARPDGPADGHIALRSRVNLFASPDARADDGFGGTIGIDQPPRLERLEHQGRVAGRQGFATRDADAQRQAAAMRLRQFAQIGRREMHHADLMAGDQSGHGVQVPFVLAHHGHGRARGQRRHPLRSRGIEVDRGGHQAMVVLAQAQARNHRVDVHGQRAVRHRNPLGQAGGAGRVDHIGQALRMA